MKKTIKVSVMLLFIAVFATFSSCSKEYQLQHNENLKKLVGTWECVSSPEFENHYTYAGNLYFDDAIFKLLARLDEDFNENDHIERPENYYVGMIWKFDEPIRYDIDRGLVEGYFSLVWNGNTYEGSYTLSYDGYILEVSDLILGVDLCKTLRFSGNIMEIWDYYMIGFLDDPDIWNSHEEDYRYLVFKKKL